VFFFLMSDDPLPDPIPLPMNGELDLHHFRPSELGELLPEFLRASQEAGYETVRIIHGKGSGALREGVHRLLERQKNVASFRLCGEGDGAWGATRVWFH